MKKITKTIIALSVLAGLVSCAKEQIPVTPDDNDGMVELTLTATQENSETRAQIGETTTGEGGKKTTAVLWSEGDCLSVFEAGSTKNNKFELTSGIGTYSGTFKGTVASAVTSLVVIHPYNSDLSFDTSYTLSGAKLEENQTATAGSFDPKTAALMAGVVPGTSRSSSSSVELKNVVGYVKVTPKFDCSKITLESKSTGDKLSGTVSAEYKNGGLTFTSTGSSNKVSISGDIKAGSTYYIAVLPVEMSGFKLSFTLSDGTVKFREGSKTLNIEASKVKNLGEIEASQLTSDQEYLQAKLDKLDAGGTVTLDWDCTGEFSVSGTVTLNLNGHKISSSAAATAYKAAITVAEGGNLTIEGGESGEISSENYFTIVNNGTLTINGGIYKSSNDDVAVYNKKGTVTLNGGSYKGNNGAVRNGSSTASANAKMIINGGKYERLSLGEGYNQYVIENAYGDITFNQAINSYNSTYSVLTVETPDSGHLSVADGVSLPMVYVMDETTPQAEVRSYVVDEATLTAAFTNANTVILNQDCTLTECIHIYSDKVLDLGFHTLTYTGGGSEAQYSAFRVADKTFTVKGIVKETEDGQDKWGDPIIKKSESGITATGNSDTERHIFWANGGKIILEGEIVYTLGECTAENATNYSIVYVDKNGTVEISAGEFNQGSKNKNILAVDTGKGTISVTGGKFWYYDPSKFVAEGYKSQYVPGEDDDLGKDYYEVSLPGEGEGEGEGDGEGAVAAG